MPSNTIAGVNLAEIAMESLPALQNLFAPLKSISTDFSADISARGESVTTRFPTRPTAVDLSSGYTAGNSAMTARTINLDTFFGWVWSFNDLERSKSSVMLNELFVQPALQALGAKVFGDLWNLVTAANFPTSSAINSSAFTRSNLADLSATLTINGAMQQGRSFLCNPTYYAALVKSMNAAEIPGFISEKAEGVVPRVAKFDIYETDLADANSESLGGFAFHKSALLIAGRSVDATGAAQAGVEVEDVVVPGLNIPVQFRKWYAPQTGALNYSVSLLYGVAVGTGQGIRVTGT
ncbi:MAG: hypothetical protein ACO265_04645 [Polynucleobacter sp.]